MGYQTHRLTWEGIEIEVRHLPQWGDCYFGHIEVRSINPKNARLPTDDLGASFHYPSFEILPVDDGSDVVSFVTDWLDKEAKSKSWIEYLESMKQLELF